MIDLITTQVKGALENQIFNKIISLNTGVSNTVLKAVVSRVAEEAAVELVKNINLGTNKSLFELPKKFTSSKNPFDLVASNFGPGDITNNLNSILQVQYSSQITNLIVTSLESKLRLTLPRDRLGIINFDNIAAILVQSITPSINSTITNTIGSVVGNLFKGRGTPPATISGIEKYFTTLDNDSALEKIDDAFSSTITNQALVEAQKFDINTEENKEKLIVLEKGFLDPTANYPTKEYSNLPETNKLAQGDASGTIVAKKNKERLLGAKLPGGESFDQPESPYRAAYPYNKVTQTEQGHIIEIDDTPGSERIHVYHSSGTFVEIDANGTVVRRTKGSLYEIVDRNGKISIAGKADISVNGACNIFVGNDANIEVEGDVNLKCHNDITAQAGGTLNLSAVEELNITSANVNIEAYSSFNMKGNVELNLHSSNVINMHSNAEIKVEAIDLYSLTDYTYFESTKQAHLLSRGDFFTQSDSDFNIKAGSNLNTDAGSDFNIISGSSVNLDSGGITYINEGAASNAAEASGSKPSVVAGSSKIGVMTGRKDVQSNEVTDPQALTLADNKSLLLEEETASDEDYTKQKSVVISEGYATSGEMDDKPVAIESETPSSIQNIFIAPDEGLKKVTGLPGNYKLSPNFTIEMLSDKAAVTRDALVAHGNYTYGDLAYNLQGLALNVLEPVKKLYPNMFVTSCFRNPGNSSNSSTSQHPRGQAVDIQFKGATKAEYYEIARDIAKNIKYDQLILEYCNWTKNPWIHISFSIEKNKTQVLTFFNHKKHSDGLTNLA